MSSTDLDFLNFSLKISLVEIDLMLSQSKLLDLEMLEIFSLRAEVFDFLISSSTTTCGWGMPVSRVNLEVENCTNISLHQKIRDHSLFM